MQNMENSITGFLREIGAIEDLTADYKRGYGLNKPVKFNTHIHLPPNFSAFETVEQAVELADEQDVWVLGAGNYYDFSVYRTFCKMAQTKGIFPLFGTEIIALETDFQRRGIRINDPGNPGKYYICGKGIGRFESFSPRADELLSMIRKNDALRMREMIRKMEPLFREHGVQTELDEQTVIGRVTKRHRCDADTVTLQERHVSQAFQEVFFEKVPVERRIRTLTEIFGTDKKSDAADAVGVQNDIRSYLMKAGKSCFVPETFVNLQQAKELILELGGIPCYPVLADGSKQRCEYETPVEKLIETLKANHYSMVEFIPIRNHPAVLAEYVTAIRKAGIVVAAGTEHNTLDLLPIEPRCVQGQPIPDAIQAIFWEGTCVLAAHQFLAAHGQYGFVDFSNRPNPRYSIEQLSRMGESVLRRYFEKFNTSGKAGRC